MSGNMTYYSNYDFEVKFNKMIIRPEEMSKAEIEKTTVLAKTVDGEEFFLNTSTGSISKTLSDIADMDTCQVLKIEGPVKIIYGVKPMYDEKQHKLCFVYFHMDTSKLYGSCHKAQWQEDCRVYFNTNPSKRKFVWRNNYALGYKYPDSNLRAASDDRFVEVPLNWKNLNELNRPENYFLLDFSGVIHDSNKEQWCWDFKDALKPFREEFGDIVPVEGNKMVALDNIYSFMDFMRYTPPENIKQTDKQRKLDGLAAKKLPDVLVPEDLPEPNIDFSANNKDINTSCGYIQRFAIIQKVPDVDEPMCVLRSFFYSKPLKCLKESGRIYIGKKEILASRVLDSGYFMYQTLLNTPYHWNLMIADFDEDAVKGTRLEYYSQVMAEIEPKDRGLAIWSFLKWPITEAMYKIEDFKPFMKDVFKLSRYKKPIDVIQCCFGECDLKATTPYKAIGMNKQQVKYLLPVLKEFMPKIAKDGCFQNKSIIHCLKLVLKADNEYSSAYGTYGYDFPLCHYLENMDISDVDIETTKFFTECLESCIDDKLKSRFDNIPLIASEMKNVLAKKAYAYVAKKYLSDLFQTVNNNMLLASKCIAKTRLVYGMDVAKKAAKSLCKHAGDTTRYSRYNAVGGFSTSTTARLGSVYCDYVEMVDSMGLTTSMKPYFETPEQLVDMHDLITELFILSNKKKSGNETKRWKKKKDEANWEKWAYENEEFMVIAPERPEDLTREGIMLHHCVGGYINKVLNGATNIMFIRRKEEPTKPFFTVEITNDNTIQQVHGLLNCNADSCPELPKFVRSWAKAKKLDISNYNKVR